MTKSTNNGTLWICTQLVIVAPLAGCSSTPPTTYSREPVSIWTAEELQMQHRLRHLEDPSFFGSPYNRWGEIVLPPYEILLSRCGYYSLFHARTNASIEECRLILLPGDHDRTSPVVVRCLRESGRVLPTSHRFTNYVSILTSPIVQSHYERSLDAWSSVLDQIRQSGYWSMAPCEDGPRGFHEWRLFLEVLEDGNYHWVDRSLGAEREPFIIACEAVFAMANIPFHLGDRRRSPPWR